MDVELIPVLEVAETNSDTFPDTVFQKLTDISDRDLVALVKEHTNDLRAGKYEREKACALSGGYVLVVNQIPVFYPQCCGDLADIYYWKKVVQGKDAYYEGHPAPQLRFSDKQVEFDFSTTVTDESFVPTPPVTKLNIDKTALAQAVECCLPDLNVFSQRLMQINQSERLGIADLDKLLVWNNLNHE